jgi:hypothetical protein
MRKLSCCATLLAMLLGAPYLFASINYVMGYTPPGGVTVTPGGGAPYSSSPSLYAYSGLNSADYQTLYYGLNYVANVAQSNVASPGNMAFINYNPSTGILAWGSTATWTFTNTITNAPVITETQFYVQIQPVSGSAAYLGTGFLNGDSTSKAALGITTGNPTDPLFQVLSGGSFQVTFQFATWDGNINDIGPGTGTDLLDFYNNNNGGNPTTVFNTSVDFEFWWSIPKTTAKTVQVGTCKTNLQNYLTIQSAVSAVPAGATIEVCPGNYNEQVTITEPLTLEGIASGTNASVVLGLPPVLEQSGTVMGFPVYAQISVQNAGPVNISGLTVDGSNASCPNGALAGVLFVSSTAPSSGKFTGGVIRFTGQGCNQGAALFAANETGSASTLTVEGNSIHDINGPGITFGPDMSGTIATNTIVNTTTGLQFQQAGPNVKATGNFIIGAQNAVSLNSANSVTVQSNQIVNSSNNAIQLQDSSAGGTNKVTGNTINEASCGLSISQAATTDTYFPNTVENAASTTCQ